MAGTCTLYHNQETDPEDHQHVSIISSFRSTRLLAPLPLHGCKHGLVLTCAVRRKASIVDVINGCMATCQSDNEWKTFQLCKEKGHTFGHWNQPQIFLW